MTKISFDYEKYLKGARAVARGKLLRVVQITPIKNRNKFVIVYDQDDSLNAQIIDKTGLHSPNDSIYDVFLEVPETWGVQYTNRNGLSFTITGFVDEAAAYARTECIHFIKPGSLKIFKCED